jgi:hypothetical protein
MKINLVVLNIIPIFTLSIRRDELTPSSGSRLQLTLYSAYLELL